MKLIKKLGAGLLLAAMVSAMSVPVQAAGVVDYDSITEAMQTDYSQAAQLPLTGWFSRTFEDGSPASSPSSDSPQQMTAYFG